MSRRTALNPTVELAREAGFDVLADLAALADTEQGSPLFQAIEERLVALVPMLRAFVKDAGLADPRTTMDWQHGEFTKKLSLGD